MILTKEYLQSLIKKGDAQYSGGTEAKSIVIDNPNSPDTSKKFVSVDRLDLQRVDHYKLGASTNLNPAQPGKENDKMRKYTIDKNIITPEGREMPRGFTLTIAGDTATIEVPSDVPGDENNLYEETIPTNQQIFAAHYDDTVKTPVHIEDGEVIGEPKE